MTTVKLTPLAREHYALLADALKVVPSKSDKTVLILNLCKLLKADNPKFDTDLFLDSAGI